MYGKPYEEDSGWCSFSGLLKLLLLFLLAIVGLIGLFAYTNPDWEGWTILMPEIPVSLSNLIYCEINQKVARCCKKVESFQKF